MQGLSNLCWAAAVLDLQQHVPLVLQLVAAIRDVWHTAAAEELQQLYQVHLWLLDCQLPAPGEGLSGVLSQQQLQQCEGPWQQQLTAKAQASPFQRSVFAVVKVLPLSWQQQPRMEQRTADGALSIDIAGTTAAGVKVAVEVDGPSHFVQPGNVPGGPTLSRNRALAVRGYAVVSVPYFEWARMQGPQQQQAYLLAKLQAVQQRQQESDPPAATAAGTQPQRGRRRQHSRDSAAAP